VDDAVLALREVQVRRGGNVLLHELTWVVEPGQRWVVLGPNGAGKTTLLALAAGYLHATRGSVEILGHRVGRVDLASLRPRIGYVSSALEELFAPTSRAIDAVVSAKHGATRVWGRHRYGDADRAWAHALLERLGVDGLAERPISTLSVGEWQRVQIARAMFHDPELVLLDEPAASVDVAGREELVAALADLAASDDVPGIVLVTHHLEEVPPGWTHAMLLRGGGVVAAGPIADVLVDDPVSTAFGLPLRVTHDDGRYAARA
jgi:iron complex transport system ATP-binding protein